MLIGEAGWLAQSMREIGYETLFPMLNVGSQTEEFRVREQPWIDRYLFAPAREKGLSVVHSDLQEMPGVDLVGDLTDPAFLAKVAAMRFRSVFCANLLEHVSNPAVIAQALVAAVEPGGVLFVSCPHVFPYHPDPIDTMYRPTPTELATLFEGTAIVRAATVRCGNLSTYLFARLLYDPAMLWRMLLPRKQQVVQRTEHGLSAREWLPWLWRPFYQTCVVLRKVEAGVQP
jgi:SAM-dependent methyltransferase